MEKTKKIARGVELELLLVAGMALPVLAGAALCLFQSFAPKITYGSLSLLKQWLLVGQIAAPFVLGVFYLLWFLFVLRVWRTLFPERKILPFLFFFSFLPGIGPMVLLPLSILIPAAKRADRTFLRSLLLVLLILVLQLQLVSCFVPLFGSYFSAEPQSLNLFLATLVLIPVAGFQACRGLAGRRPAASASLLCGVLILILAGEYLCSTILLRSERTRYENAVAALEELRVPLDNAAMRDFYQNGSPFDRERAEQLQALIEPLENARPGEKDEPDFLRRLDLFAENPVPVKDPASWLPPIMRPSRFADMSWPLLFDVYRRRISGARSSGDNEKLLPLLQQERNLLQTFFDEPDPAVFDGLCRVLDRRAGQMTHLLSSGDLPLYILAALESVYREDEESLQYACRRLCFRNSWYAERQAELLPTGYIPDKQFLANSMRLPNVERARYALGAPFFNMILSDRTRTAVLSRKLLDFAPWELDRPTLRRKWETLQKSQDERHLFAELMNYRIRSFEKMTDRFFRTLSRVRGARALAAAAVYRAAHEGKLPEDSSLLADPLSDPMTGRPYSFASEENGALRLQESPDSN